MEKFKVERELKDLTHAELLDIYDSSTLEAHATLREEIIRRMDKPPVYYNQLQQFGGLDQFGGVGVAK